MKFKSTSSDSRVRSLRLLLALACLLPLLALAAPPGWWTDRQVLDPNAAKSDFGSVNQGQLKNMAKKAYAELRNALPSEIWTTPEGQALAALVDSWNPAQTGNLDLINQGQLKAVAKKFYDVLILHGYTNAYPWTGATTAAANDALANLGQLKNLFSFDLTRDSDGDGIPDWRETKFNLNPFNAQTNLTLPQPPSPAQLVIGVPNDWQGWTRIGRSDDPGVYGSGSTSTSALYDVYANQFYLNAASGTSNIPVGNQYVTGDPTGEFTYSPGAFTGEHRILGIGVRGLPGSNVSGFTPTVRFDLGNDSYSAATNVEAGRTSFSLYSHSGDFTVQFQPVAFGASSIYRPSNITFRGDNGYVYTLPGGIGSGASYDFAFRAIPLTLSNSYQMFFDLDAMQSLYSNVSLFQATFNRQNVLVAPGTNYNGEGIGTIGSKLTIAFNGLSNNTTVFSVDAPPRPPVDIAVRKKGTSAAPDDGLIVKKGDILEFALAPNWFDQPKQFENLITWESRKLKADGTFETDWTAFGAHGKGTKFEHTTDYGGIYQIRAVITGSQDKPQYVRKKDAIHATGSDGKYNEELRKGKPDFIGVVDDDWQITLRNTAKGFLGSTAYAQAVHIPAYAGGPNTKGSNKCNIFVFHCCNSSGVPVPLTWSYFSISKPGNISMPPLANHWADPSSAIPKWTFLGAAMPQLGYVVVRKGTAGFSGHMGILNYDGTWINAGHDSVNQSIHLSTHPKYQPALFRKYTP